ncbi:MAG: Holliday junction resolvase RuvX [Chloroflexi bacterium]|nr:Holliday junction resolvase RuvX [Chloroflexota bacterium]
MDVGERRIGVAVGSVEDGLAVPVEVIDRSVVANLWETIERYATSRDVDVIVVGMPFSLDGTMGPQAQETAAFVDKLKSKVSVAVETWDERYSSVEADRLLRAASGGRSSRKRSLELRRTAQDAVAASVMLQSYLDAKRGERH